MIYAVGDIHGRFDLLKVMHKLITEDSETREGPYTIIFIGDYIDRGPESCQVIKFLLSKPFKGFNHIFLKGNHEQMMIDEITSYEATEKLNSNSMWLYNGGIQTLNSYKQGFKDPIITKHVKWMKTLKVTHKQDNILFVHAGINPEVSEDKWAENECLWIRDKFLRYTQDHKYLIVHGHTIRPEYDPWFDPNNITNRINLDTGAFYHNILTAVIFDGDKKEFLEAKL